MLNNSKVKSNYKVQLPKIHRDIFQRFTSYLLITCRNPRIDEVTFPFLPVCLSWSDATGLQGRVSSSVFLPTLWIIMSWSWDRSASCLNVGSDPHSHAIAHMNIINNFISTSWPPQRTEREVWFLIADRFVDGEQHVSGDSRPRLCDWNSFWLRHLTLPVPPGVSLYSNRTPVPI